MPVETKKVLWTVFSVGVVLIAFFGLALLLFYPKQGMAKAPASVGNASPARVEDPQDYLGEPPPAARPEPAAPQTVIIYGERPDEETVPPTEAPAGSAATAPATSAPATTPTAPAAAPQGSTTAQPAAAPKPAAATKPAAAPKPATATKPAAKPATSTKPTTVTVTEYWIQAASFTSRERAESLKAALAEKGLSSVITVKDIDGKSYYRVRIGPYTVKSEADGWLARVKAFDGCVEAFVSRSTVERRS